MRNKVFIAIVGLSFCTASFSQPNKAKFTTEQKEIVSRLPEGKLTLDIVLAKAMQSSAAFQALKSQALAVDAPGLKGESIFGSHLFAAATLSRNDNRQRSIFEAEEAKSYSIGMRKYFQSGTALGVELSDTQTKLNSSNTFQTPNRTAAKVSLEQSLWKDSFGYLSRRSLESARAATRAARATFVNSLEEWSVGLAKVYYGALSGQTQVENARENLARRERLLSTMKLKLNRGTSEKPDLLLVESAQIQARAELELAKSELQRIWRDLVTSLRLPSDWQKTPAEIIPLFYDQNPEKAQLACQEKGSVKKIQDTSAEVQMWKAKTEESEQAYLAARNAYSPDLKLVGNILSSGSLGNLDDRAEKTFEAKNIEWSAGLKFQMPFSWESERADLLIKAAQFQQNKANFDRVFSEIESGWANQCEKLSILFENRKEYDRSVRVLTERLRLEEDRFRVGRISTFNVIEAGDQLARVQLLLSQTRLNLYVASWEILKVLGEIESHLQKVAKKYEQLDILGDKK